MDPGFLSYRLPLGGKIIRVTILLLGAKGVLSRAIGVKLL